MSLYNQPKNSRKPDIATKYKQGKISYKTVLNLITGDELMQLWENKRLAGKAPQK